MEHGRAATAEILASESAPDRDHRRRQHADAGRAARAEGRRRSRSAATSRSSAATTWPSRRCTSRRSPSCGATSRRSASRPPSSFSLGSSTRPRAFDASQVRSSFQRSSWRVRVARLCAEGLTRSPVPACTSGGPCRPATAGGLALNLRRWGPPQLQPRSARPTLAPRRRR